MQSRDDNSNPLIFTKADRIAIITIVSIVAVVVIVSYLYPVLLSKKTLANRSALDSLLMMQDAAVVEGRSLETEQMQSSLTPFKFNPNEMSDEQWQQLGLTERQIHSINNYLAKGGNFKIKADFARLYCISEEEYDILEPYIQLPETYGKPNSFKDKRKNDKSVERKSSQPSQAPKDLLVDLNTADSVMLMSLPHMSKYMASRIVRYKNSLGNFVDVGQLLEVKGIDTAMFQSLVPYLAMSQVDLAKINVNTFEFKSLLRHPYLDYDQVKSIVNYREKRGFITDWEQLCLVLNEKGKVNPRLEYYVEF